MLDISEVEVFSEKDCVVIIVFGMEVVVSGGDVLIFGEMGIGNIMIVVVLVYNLFGGEVGDWVGFGMGVDDEGLKNKVDVLVKVCV